MNNESATDKSKKFLSSWKNAAESVVVLHDYMYADAVEDELFNLRLAQDIARVLETRFPRVECRAYGRETMEELKARKKRGEKLVVFNLVENVSRKGEWQYKAAEALEKAGIPFTGCGSAAMRLDASKQGMKIAFVQHDLPTAAWFTPEWLEKGGRIPGPCIVKSATYHGSCGLTADSVSDDPATLLRLIRTNQDLHGGAWYAEQYIHGREFYLGMIGRAGEDPEFLPLGEVIFHGNAFKDQPHILSYDAKWQENGIGFTHGACPGSPALLRTMEDLAQQCWHAFRLNGYARVDFRVDDKGQPWLLEINANPYMGLDDSFILRATAQAGCDSADVLAHIVACANRPVLTARRVERAKEKLPAI